MKSFLLIILLSFVFLHAETNQLFPKQDSNIIDQENLLSQNVKNDINNILQDHEKRKLNQIAVVILKSLNNYKIEDYSKQLKQQWNMKENNVIVLISLNDKKILIDVSNNLKNKVTNEIINEIIEYTIKPNFKAKQYELGTLKAINEIILALQYEYTPKDELLVFSTGNNFIFLITILFFLITFLSMFINSISKKRKSFFVYRFSKSISYASFIGYISFFISKTYTIHYLTVFILVFSFIFLVCYFFTKDFDEITLNETSKYIVNLDDNENILENINSISKNTNLTREKFLHSEKGNAYGNW